MFLHWKSGIRSLTRGAPAHPHHSRGVAVSVRPLRRRGRLGRRPLPQLELQPPRLLGLGHAVSPGCSTAAAAAGVAHGRQ